MEIINHVLNVTVTLNDSLISSNSDIINQIFPNLYVFIAHTLSLIFLMILLTRLAWNPTKKYIEKRTKEIQRNIESAEKARIESEKNLEISKANLLDSKNTAAQIIETAEINAQEKSKKIELAAINKANHIENEGISKIKKQELEMEKRMNLEVSKLALETAEMFLSKKIDDEENKKIIDNIVNDLASRVKSSNDQNK